MLTSFFLNPTAAVLVQAAVASPPTRPHAGALALQDLTTALPACSATPDPSPSIDFEQGCASQACPGMRLDALTELLGAPDACSCSERSDRCYCD